MSDAQDIWQNFVSEPCEATFTPVYERTKGLVWTLCYRILGNTEDARDGFQSVYCRLFAEVKAGTWGAGDDADFTRALYRLAVRESQNLWRRRARRAGREVAVDALFAKPDEAPAADEIAARRQLREQVEALARLLPENVRLPVQLHLFHGLSQAEIGRILSVTQSTASRRIARGLRHLEALLRRAGLAEASRGGAVLAVAGIVLEPPGALSAGTVYAQVQSALATGAATGALAGKMGIGAMLMHSKVAIGLGVAILTLGALIGGKQLITHAAYRPDAAVKAALAKRAGAETAGNPAAAGDAARLAGDAARASAAGGANSQQVVSGKTALPAQSDFRTTGAMVVGRVIDSETKKAVGNATVEISEKLRTHTDIHGIYRIGGVRANKAEVVRATAPGHAGRYGILAIPETGQVVQNFELDPAVDVQVQVKDPEGAPVEGADIDIMQPHTVMRSAGKTDARGQLLVPALSRLQPPILSANKTGTKEVDSGSSKIRFNPEKTRGEITIILEAIRDMNRAIRGRVVDSGGAPVPLVSVQWSPKYGIERGAEMTLTDENGHYSLMFQNDDPACKLSVFGEGWAPAVNEDVIAGTPEHPAEVNFKIEPGHWLRGIVVDERDQPVAQARLEVMPTRRLLHSWSFPGVTRRLTTDAEGKFSVKEISGPTVALCLRPPKDSGQNAMQYVDEQPVDREIRLTLKGPGAIAGRVEDKETGKPIPTFNIRLTDGGGYVITRYNPGETFNSPQGRFVLGDLLQDQQMGFDVAAEGYITASIKNITVKPEKKAEETVVRLTRGHEIRGVILDAATRAPLSGVKVNYGVWEGGNFAWSALGNQRNFGNAQEVVTDAAGLFSIKEDEPGTFFIQAPGYRRLVVTPPKRNQYLISQNLLRITLTRSAESIGGIYFINGHPGAAWYLSLGRRSEISGPGGAPVYEGSDLPKVGANGRFGMDGLQPGTYRLSSGIKGPENYRTGGMNVSRDFELKAGEQKAVNFGDELGPFVFRGHLLDARGTPLDRVYLVLMPDYPTPYVEFSSYVAADFKGRFWIPWLSPGRYRVAFYGVNDPAMRMTFLPPIEISGNTERDLVVPLPKP